jgi:sugar/nucleoside kinase (ribokinase family)
MRHVPVTPVQEADPTGAGDIFAAAFFIRLHRNNGDPWDAARFANGIAAATVKAVGLDAKTAAIDGFTAKKQSF